MRGPLPGYSLWRAAAPEGESLTSAEIARRYAIPHKFLEQILLDLKKAEFLESRRGNTSHQMYPWFALDKNGAATQEHGDVWFGALGWSGNWKIVVEETPMHQVRVTGGYNTFDFSYPLKPGQRLETPSYYGGFSAGGFGGASHWPNGFSSPTQ